MAYGPLPTHWKNTFNPATLEGYPETGEYVLQTLVYDPEDTIRVYLPPGAIRVSLRFGQLEQDAKLGAVVRLGQYPQCNYVIVEEDYYDLPWGPYDGTTVAALNGLDFQARNLGGQIIMLSNKTASITGEWIYIKVLKYESTNVGSIRHSVTVDAEDYKAWYDNYTEWDAQDNPTQPFSGDLGGYCNPAWGEQDPPPYVPVLIIF